MKRFIFSLVAFLMIIAGTEVAFAGQGTGTPAAASTTVSAPVTAAPTVKKGGIQRFAEKVMAKMYKAVSDDNWLVALVLAFFVGYLGLHRVYMGASPITILWYIITFGGIFGIIPFIDFILLIIDGNTSRFEGKNGLIAW